MYTTFIRLTITNLQNDKICVDNIPFIFNTIKLEKINYQNKC